MTTLKTEKDADNCWSVWVKCDCCDDGWHWIFTSMGPDAEENANRWMENISSQIE